MWYKNSGKDSDVALSTRVRLARNLKEYAFAEKLSDEKSAELIEKVRAVFDGKSGWSFTDMKDKNGIERGSMVEEHIISRDFAEKKTASALISNEEKSVYIMILEEDHLRIQSIISGNNLEVAMKRVFEAEEMIDEALEIAFSEKLGYITHCPTNLGTGMRASVMLHLPAYTKSGYLKSLSYQLSKMGFTIRGMEGEGSAATAYLYQISNEVTLGISEEETISKLSSIIREIVAKEREFRNALSSDTREELIEKARRDIGIIMYAGRLTSTEVIEMYSELRLAASLGYIGVEPTVMDELFISSMPNTVAKNSKSEDRKNDPISRDRSRASAVREIISKTSIVGSNE